MIPITKLNIGEEEACAAAEVVRSGWLAQGSAVAQLERAVAGYVGARAAVAVSSGTAALHLALLGAGVGPGHEVIVPSLSFIATANAVRYCGALPVFAEIDGRTFNLDPEKIEEKCSSRTRAILAVDQLGLPASMNEISEVARRVGVEVIEDAACALGAVYRGRRVGAQMRFCCFSFHPRKVITTGEGGMITTDDEQLAARLRILRAQGVSVSPELRNTGASVVREEYAELGYNYRLPDVLASIGVQQMRRLPELLTARRERAERYQRQLSKMIPSLTLPCEERLGEHAWQSYMVLLDKQIGEARREQVLQGLLERGVSARRAVMAAHLEPLYRGAEGVTALAITEDVARRGLMLPLYPQMSDAEQDEVVTALRAVLEAP